MDDAVDETVRSPRRKAWLWGGVAVGAVVVIAVIAYFVASGNGGGPSASPSASASATASAPAATPTAGADPSAQPTPVPSATTGTMPELAPVAPDKPSDNNAGLVAEITAMKAVQGEAVQAGDIGGPSVQFALKITNKTDASIDLGFISVNAYIGANRTPAGSLIKPGGAPFDGTLKPGESAKGVYVYNIPEKQRDDVTLTIDYRAGQPAFVFRGQVG